VFDPSKGQRSISTNHRTWQGVFNDEAKLLQERRGDADAKPRVVGLAISGGGIRSATFALGVLESLKTLGLLKKVDYLSTVSGGGFIGGWLTANCQRNPGWLEPTSNWSSSIAHLRDYSNYLSPRVGFFSADTWSMVTIWIRNTLLIQTTVILAIACALLLPRPIFELFAHWPRVGNWRWVTILLFVLGIVGIAGNQMRLTSENVGSLLRGNAWRTGLMLGVAGGGAAWVFARWIGFEPFHGGPVSYWASAPVAILLVLTGFVLQPVAVRLVELVWPLVGRMWPGDKAPEEINYTQGWVQCVVVIPLMGAAYLVAAILWGAAAETADTVGLHSFNSYGELLNEAWRFWPFPLSVVFVSFWLLSFCSIRRQDTVGVVTAAWAPLVAVPVFHALLSASMLLLRWWAADPARGAWNAFVWAPTLVSGAFVVAIVVLIGMMGRQSTDDAREWWSRLAAWLGIYSVAWMLITLSAVYGPRFVGWALENHWWTSMSVGGGWIGTVIGGLFAGKSQSTSGTGSNSPATIAKEAIAVIGPFVFIAGLLIGVAFVVDEVINLNANGGWQLVGRGEHSEHALFLQVSLVAFACCFAALLLMAARVDINQFSLNAFYRNRLVRCYLGATRFKTDTRERRPQNFTGFDDHDDMPLADVVTDGKLVGPLHIVNCALNLGGSSDLALHTRHSAAFTLSGLHCGTAYDQSGKYEELGYVRTSVFGGKAGAPTLGQAMAVSGAAASPNMGYHTSPVTAFLLTVLNLRLGWWFPNPGKAAAETPTPWFSLRYLFAELFGGANDTSRFVMISDGGHFENLAAYELIRRRCGVIIISDGECDPQLSFSGLGTLIRMCEVDFVGVKINIDVREIRPVRPSIWSSKRCAVGEIDYGPDHPKGILIYLKASMTGNEDTAVLQYKAAHQTFPHERTGDQFYGEDQFESYRELGREVACEAFEPPHGMCSQLTNEVLLNTRTLRPAQAAV
jgi:hypothetical protein